MENNTNIVLFIIFIFFYMIVPIKKESPSQLIPPLPCVYQSLNDPRKALYMRTNTSSPPTVPPFFVVTSRTNAQNNLL